MLVTWWSALRKTLLAVSWSRSSPIMTATVCTLGSTARTRSRGPLQLQCWSGHGLDKIPQAVHLLALSLTPCQQTTGVEQVAGPASRARVATLSSSMVSLSHCTVVKYAT